MGQKAKFYPNIVIDKYQYPNFTPQNKKNT